nr:immunoglobulin heavy chain junction region [Macaca mulatta]
CARDSCGATSCSSGYGLDSW